VHAGKVGCLRVVGSQTVHIFSYFFVFPDRGAKVLMSNKYPNHLEWEAMILSSLAGIILVSN